MNTVIFDFDGTIADSFPAAIKIAHQLTKKPELANFDQVETYRDKNFGLLEAMNKLDIPKWKLPWLLLRGRKIMSNQIETIPLVSGMDDVLADLKKATYGLFVISSNSTSNIDKFLLEKGLMGYFTKVYGGASLFNKAKLIAKLIKQENLDPKNCIYVGDEVRDVEAAQKLNVACIAVNWGYNSDSLLAKANPMVIARSPKQLKSVILEWGNTI